MRVVQSGIACCAELKRVVFMPFAARLCKAIVSEAIVRIAAALQPIRRWYATNGGAEIQHFHNEIQC